MSASDVVVHEKMNSYTGITIAGYEMDSRKRIQDDVTNFKSRMSTFPFNVCIALRTSIQGLNENMHKIWAVEAGWWTWLWVWLLLLWLLLHTHCRHYSQLCSIQTFHADCMGKNVPLRLLSRFGINIRSKRDRKITLDKPWRCSHQWEVGEIDNDVKQLPTSITPESIPPTAAIRSILRVKYHHSQYM